MSSFALSLAMETLLRNAIENKIRSLWVKFGAADALIKELETCERETLEPLYETLVRMEEDRANLPQQQYQRIVHLVKVKRVEFVQD